MCINQILNVNKLVKEGTFIIQPFSSTFHILNIFFKTTTPLWNFVYPKKTMKILRNVVFHIWKQQWRVKMLLKNVFAFWRTKFKLVVVILTCTISNCNHYLIFWTLDYKIIINRTFFNEMSLWIHYVHIIKFWNQSNEWKIRIRTFNLL